MFYLCDALGRIADSAATLVAVTYAQDQSWPAHCYAQGIPQHTGGQPAQENGATDPESAAKRRRRSEDRDVSEAAAAADADGAPADGPKPVNGHAVTAAHGDVPPEAAFWTALEDAKDEVSALLIITTLHHMFGSQAKSSWDPTKTQNCIVACLEVHGCMDCLLSSLCALQTPRVFITHCHATSSLSHVTTHSASLVFTFDMSVQRYAYIFLQTYHLWRECMAVAVTAT